jgi:hypothetical protein
MNEFLVPGGAYPQAGGEYRQQHLDPSIVQKNTDKAYWFRARRSGRGWGLPSSAPGWLFFLGWFAVLILFIVRLLPQQPFEFIITPALWSSIYILVCYTMGEPMPPRPGNDS